MLVGRARALEIMCTGRELDAAELERLGLVLAVHPRERLLAEAQALAARIAASGPLATRGAKRIVSTRLYGGFGEARALSDTLRHALEWSRDVDEGHGRAPRRPAAPLHRSLSHDPSRSHARRPPRRSGAGPSPTPRPSSSAVSASAMRRCARTSTTLARALLALGVSRGDRVAVLLPNRPEWLITAFAAAKVGAPLVAISTFSTPREIAWTLEHARPRVIVTMEAFRGRVYLGAIHEVCPGAGHGGARRVSQRRGCPSCARW